jgi:hypothetical protein
MSKALYILFTSCLLINALLWGYIFGSTSGFRSGMVLGKHLSWEDCRKANK